MRGRADVEMNSAFLGKRQALMLKLFIKFEISLRITNIGHKLIVDIGVNAFAFQLDF